MSLGCSGQGPCGSGDCSACAYVLQEELTELLERCQQYVPAGLLDDIEKALKDLE